MGNNVYIGTSGWNYDGWKDSFYADVPKKRWLEHSASCFNALEVNGTFYRLQSESTFARWKQQTPGDFVFAAKGHRFVTHNKKLLDPEETVIRSRDNMRTLEPKLKVVLWQMPDTFKRNDDRLEHFLKTLGKRWTSVRHAMEFRHPSWFVPEIAELLERYAAANCLSDAADWPLWDAVTTDVVYVRLHGHTRTYASAYSERLLDDWAARIRRWSGEGRDVHVYFDNDAEGAAPYDALALMERLGVRPAD